MCTTKAPRLKPRSHLRLETSWIRPLNPPPSHRPGRGRVYDSIADAIGDTPLVRLNKLPQQQGVKATILAKLEYFNPAASVKDRIGSAMISAMEKSGIIKPDTVLIEPTSATPALRLRSWRPRRAIG